MQGSVAPDRSALIERMMIVVVEGNQHLEQKEWM